MGLEQCWEYTGILFLSTPTPVFDTPDSRIPLVILSSGTVKKISHVLEPQASYVV